MDIEKDRSIWAWTEAQGYTYFPQFINLSFDAAAEKLKGRRGVRLYCRGVEAIDNDGVSAGATAAIIIPLEALKEMVIAIEKIEVSK